MKHETGGSTSHRGPRVADPTVDDNSLNSYEFFLIHANDKFSSNHAHQECEDGESLPVIRFILVMSILMVAVVVGWLYLP